MSSIGLKESIDMQTNLLRLGKCRQLATSGLVDLEALRVASLRQEGEKRKTERIDSFLKVVPQRFLNKSWEDYKIDYSGQARCKQIAEKFVRTFTQRLQAGNCLKFFGPPGTGKTLLSLIMLQNLAYADFSVGYEPSLNFLRMFQEQEFESFAAYRRLLDSYKWVQFLIIDEVGVGVGKGAYPCDWQRNHLYALINMRYNHHLCTLVISNHTEEELIERLGEPIMGRLSEQGITLAFNWPSYRRNKMHA
jgi:DNA replication protein DnaC